MRSRLGELVIAVDVPNFRRVAPACLSFAIAAKARWIGDADLSRQGGDNLRRHLGRIGEKGAEEPYRAELHSETKAHVIPPSAPDHRKIGVVEMEMAIELFPGGNVVEASVPALLLGRQKADRHSRITELSRGRSNRRGPARQ